MPRSPSAWRAAANSQRGDPAITYPTAAPGDALLYQLDGGGYTTTVPSIDGSAHGVHTVSIKPRTPSATSAPPRS